MYTVQIKSKYLVTSFFTHKLLATFDNVSGENKYLIYSIFHIEICSQFYDIIDSYSIVKVDREKSSSSHPSIHLIVMLPMRGYTNKKMEMMFLDILTNYCTID